MTRSVSDNDESLEAGTLTGAGHLLNGTDLHHFLFKAFFTGHRGRTDSIWARFGRGDEVINDLGFLDGKSKQINLLEALDETALDETTELGHGDPLALITITASTTAAATSTVTTTITMTTTTTATASKTSFSSGRHAWSGLLQ